MNPRVAVMVIMALALCGCSEREPQSAGPVTVERFEIKPTDNALRLEAHVVLSSPAEVKIEHRKSSGEGKGILSASNTTATEHTVPIIIMEEDTPYLFSVMLDTEDGSRRVASASYRTGKIPADIHRPEKITDTGYRFEGYIYFAWKNIGQCFIMNADGRLVWYDKMEDKGSVCYNYNPDSKSVVAITQMRDDSFCGTWIRETDLYGNILFEAHYKNLENPDVHHDIFKTSEGNYAVINQVRKQYDLSHLGGRTYETVTGDGITLLNPRNEVLWTWDCFSEIDPREDEGILGDKGEYAVAHIDDWVHANSVITDSEGNYLVSFNKLDQFWKIDGRTGEVIYRLGKNGDIAIPDDACTSHIHTLSIDPSGKIVVLDNGFHSKLTRAVIFDVNEKTMSASVETVELAPEDFSGNQSSVYRMDERRMLFGSTVPGTIIVTDIEGNTLWKYKTIYPFYRAIYIPEID